MRDQLFERFPYPVRRARVLRWYRAGADVQTKLPLLATYMGHVSIVSTQYYLPFVEALAAAAATRFADRCGRLLEAPGAPGGAP